MELGASSCCWLDFHGVLLSLAGSSGASGPRGYQEAGMGLGMPAVHTVPPKPSVGLEKMQELYGVGQLS